MKHNMRLAQNPFMKIKGSNKIIEARIFDKKRRDINVGDFIEFARSDNLTETILTEVKALYRYPAFSDLFSDFPISYFGGSSKKKLLDEIRQFYSTEEEEKFGVIGIKFELADKKRAPSNARRDRN